MATQVSDTGGKTKARGSSDELAVIAQRAQAFTNASGTAIALTEGNSDEIICRARSGSSAPDVGTALRVEGSFTGLCIQTGKELATFHGRGRRRMSRGPEEHFGKVEFAPDGKSLAVSTLQARRTSVWRVVNGTRRAITLLTQTSAIQVTVAACPFFKRVASASAKLADACM